MSRAEQQQSQQSSINFQSCLIRALFKEKNLTVKIIIKKEKERFLQQLV
jgi:hypothetical protein